MTTPVSLCDPADVQCLANEANLNAYLDCVASGVCTAIPTASTCQEDDPCFDCSTMGNLICGPTTTTASTSAARTLPATGNTSTPVVGGALLFTVLGIIAVLGSRRRTTETRTQP